MKTKLIYTMILFFIAGGFLYSQTVEEIINNSLKARGDVESFKNMTSLHITGTQSQMGMSIPYKYFMKDKKKYRMESEGMGQKVVMAFDGDSLWIEGQGQLQIVPAEYIEQVLSQIKQIESFVRGTFLNYKEDRDVIEFSGSVTEDGRDSYTLKITDTMETESFIYVDKKSYEAFKFWRSVEGQNGEEVEIEIKFSEYKPVNGFSVHHKMDLRIGDQTINFTIEKFELNAPVEDNMFVKPIKALPGTPEPGQN